jgi:hypothetical protein
MWERKGPQDQQALRGFRVCRESLVQKVRRAKKVIKEA